MTCVSVCVLSGCVGGLSVSANENKALVLCSRANIMKTKASLTVPTSHFAAGAASFAHVCLQAGL